MWVLSVAVLRLIAPHIVLVGSLSFQTWGDGGGVTLEKMVVSSLTMLRLT